MSHPLDEVNLTELVQMARAAGLGNITADRDAIIEALEHGEPGEPCLLEERRELMQEHIHRNFDRLRTQLPNCNGKCVTFGCPAMVVVDCWEKFRKDML